MATMQTFECDGLRAAFESHVYKCGRMQLCTFCEKFHEVLFRLSIDYQHIISSVLVVSTLCTTPTVHVFVSHLLLREHFRLNSLI